MDDIEARILSYPHLSDEEQRKVEAYVASNPEWTPLLRDVRALEGLVADTKASLSSNPLLATYVAVQHLHPEEVPPSLRRAFAQLEARLEENEALRRKAERARHRLKEAEAAIDPASHFEELTGHALEGRAGPEGTKAPASGAKDAATPSLGKVFRELPLLVRRGAVAVVLLMVLYGGLYGVSVATQSPLDRLAAVEVSDQVVRSYVRTETRGMAPVSDTLSVDKLYLEALSTLRTARASTLGLFPHYTPEKLNRAERLLKQVLDRVKRGSFLALEARFYLGKVLLAQEEVGAARTHFKAVVRQGGRQKEEAHEILKTLQRRSLGQNR